MMRFSQVRKTLAIYKEALVGTFVNIHSDEFFAQLVCLLKLRSSSMMRFSQVHKILAIHKEALDS